jgi:glutaminyl-tRNA synthetase
MAEPSSDEKILPERLKDKVEDNIPDKIIKKEKAPKAPNQLKAPKVAKPSASKPSKPTNDVPSEPMDPDAMFKQGFLKTVRAERPTDHVVTRFPPEPNGYLHLGHSKAIAINFGFARFHGGDCYLRFDDTNPEAEERKFFVAIEEMVAWLGFKPCKVTYSSDNFDKLYELAEQLILADGAYMCHCTAEEINLQRGGKNNRGPRYACPHRNRPVEESLTEFRAMRDGKYKPKEAFLRMKQDLNSGNASMWDLSAYRIIDQPHYRTGSKWRIYPTYDFTHCLCDSFEGITHSLCTVEFELQRESYEWLCDAVKVYKPMQREYGRLNVEGSITSKRKIAKLVELGIVRDWDDPRLNTLVALRRRGVPPGAILSFVNELGVTKATSNIQMARFEQSLRKYLEMSVPRLMLILDPIPVIIDNLPDDYLEEVEMPFAPKDPVMGNHVVPFTKTVYIDRTDFREVDSKDYKGLAPGKSVGLLKVAYPIKETSFKKDESSGLVTEIHAEYEKPVEGTTFKKPKGYISWVAKSEKHNSPIQAEVRILNPLFKSASPDSVEGGFLNDVREDSEEIFPNAMVETGLSEVRRRAPWPEEAGEQSMKKGELIADGKETADGVRIPFETVRFQGMRVAYFCMDKDSTADKIVLNRIVSLKEDAGKGV